jgi:hypothetical protein
MSHAFRPLFSMRSAVFSSTFVVAAALLAACPGKSQSLTEYIAAICAAHFRDASSAEMPFLTENVTAMSRMIVDMGIKPSGDVDRDFVAMMVRPHQGAIEMAQAELRSGPQRKVVSFAPVRRSPSQCTGTARSSISAGRSRVETISRICPCPLFALWLLGRRT